MSEKKKILFIPGWYPGRLRPANGIFIRQQALSVADSCETSVLYVTPDPDLQDRSKDVESGYEDSLFTVRVYYKKFESPFRFLSRLISMIRYLACGYTGFKIILKQSGMPDLVHLNIVYPAGLIALCLKWFWKIPYVITEHYDVYLRVVKGFEKIPSGLKAVIRFIMTQSRAIIVDSSAAKNAMIQLGLKGNYHIIPCVADMQANQIRKSLPSGMKKFIHISLMRDKQKNISGILHAVQQVYQKRKDFEFHLIGEGPDKGTHEETAGQLNILNRCVFFHGYVSEEDKIRFLIGSDCHVLFSHYEGFSVVTAEALACGVPVIATRCGGPEDFVNDRMGILVQPGNQKELEAALNFMLDHSQDYDPVKLKEYAKSRFSSRVVGDQILRVYESVFYHTQNGTPCAE
jgi:glycosyltransferase involved in cell wall biosynthesis